MEKENSTGKLEVYLLIAGIISLSFLAPYAMSQTGPAANYRNVSVTTRVNITNSIPEVIAIIIPNPITLNAGSTHTVNVNVTVRDFDGAGTIDNVNATFFDASNTTANASDDNNNHYTNSSCTLDNANGNFANYTCNFSVWYYANNGTQWTVNVSVNDTGGLNSSSENTTTILGLLAINVSEEIDFGNLAVGDINDPSIEANVTNFGNVLINVSVWGYGSVPDDGLAMVCDFRNITISNERFDLNSTTAWSAMTSVTSSAQHIPGLQLPQRNNDSVGGEVINQTYWRLRVPVAENPGGQCNGTLIFQAESP